MRIVLDAMGSDDHPLPEVQAAIDNKLRDGDPLSRSNEGTSGGITYPGYACVCPYRTRERIQCSQSVLQPVFPTGAWTAEIYRFIHADTTRRGERRGFGCFPYPYRRR